MARRPRTAAIVLVVVWCLLFLATAPPADAAGTLAFHPLHGDASATAADGTWRALPR